MRRLSILTSMAILVALVPSLAVACDVCYGNADNSMIDGARAGVLLMLGVTVLVLGSFATFFLRLRQRIVSNTRLRQEA